MGTPINQPACGDDYFVCELIYARSEAPAELVNLPQVQRAGYKGSSHIHRCANRRMCSSEQHHQGGCDYNPYIRSRLRARAPRNSGLALVVEDEADYDSEAYHDVWAEIGVWLSPGMRRSPLRPRGGQIPIILSTATPCHDPRPPLQSWDMVPSTHDEQEVTKIDVGKGNPAERLLLTSTLSCVFACLWPRIASRFAKPCQ